MSKCEKDQNQLRELWALGKGQSGTGTLSPTYLRWCDQCNTIYILTPEKIDVMKKGVPLLEYGGLRQIEVL